MAEVGIDRSTAWNVRSAVSLNRNLRYSVRTPVTFTRTAYFQVLATLTKVGIDRTIIWSDRQAAELTRTTYWQVIAPPQSSSATVYAVYQNAFDRVHVDFMVIGSTRVTWTLANHFIEDTPYVFQVQAGYTGLPDGDDWVDVGSPVTDTFVATDTTRRWYGKSRTAHYRVRLTTAQGNIYYSQPATTLGDLNWRDWHIAQEIVRKEKLRHKWFTSPEGYLLKQKRDGVRCSRCIDAMTDAPKDSKCPVCYGTGWDGGYFSPHPLSYADISNEKAREARNAQTGMEKSVVVMARFNGAPQLDAQDVWVNSKSDYRYEIHAIATEAQVRGVPIVVTAELRLLPPHHIIYQFPL